jgi:hypothetical protein
MLLCSKTSQLRRCVLFLCQYSKTNHIKDRNRQYEEMRQFFLFLLLSIRKQSVRNYLKKNSFSFLSKANSCSHSVIFPIQTFISSYRRERNTFQLQCSDYKVEPTKSQLRTRRGTRRDRNCRSRSHFSPACQWRLNGRGG